MSNDPQNFEEWVVDLGDIVQNVPFPGIPTEPLQASTDHSEEKPSIFCDSYYPLLVYFAKSCSYYPERREDSGWQFVAFMRRWIDLDVRSYLEYIQEKQHLARHYYQRYNYDNRNKTLFPEYLLINSCIVLFAILLFQNVRDGIEILSGTKEKKWVPGERSSEFYILYQYITKNPMEIKLQMLSMDYQIPLFVVESIYTNHSSLSKLVGTPIDKLALSCFDDLYPGVHKSKVHGGTITLPPGGYKHLLHMFHWSRTPEGKFIVEAKSLEPIKNLKNMGDFYIPNATDLQLCATVFEKHAGIHISYYNRGLSGVMEIAPLHIYKYSFEIYDILLKFERAYVVCGFPVTAYVACMMRLLQTKVDAKLLRANGIGPSTGIVEKDVLSFVQKFSNVLSYDVRMPKDLNILSEKVRAHHEKSYIRSYAELKRRYFANPWVTISVIAGILLFVLSFIHIVLAFIQTKYSVHSYKNN